MFDGTFMNNCGSPFGSFSAFNHSASNTPSGNRFMSNDRESPVTVMKPNATCIDDTTYASYAMASPSTSVTRNSDTPCSSTLGTQHFHNGLIKLEDDKESVRSSASNAESLESGQHQCQDCGKVFAERSLLNRHRVSHATAKYMCHVCSRPFMRDDKLKRHIRCVHTTERPFKCDVCSKAFARKDKLQEHVRHHNKDITFTCSVCSELFVMRSHLNRHLRTVHGIKVHSAQPTDQALASGAAGCQPSTGMSSSDQASKSAFTPVSSSSSSTLAQSLEDSLNTHWSSSVDSMRVEYEPKNRRKSTAKRSRKTGETVGSSFSKTTESPMDNNGLLQFASSHNIQHPNPLSLFIPAAKHAVGQSGWPPVPPFGSTNSLGSQQASMSATASSSSFNAPCVPGRLSHPGRMDHSLMSKSAAAAAAATTPPPQQQLDPAQQQPTASWSAAMAASLLAPVNYAGWWPQQTTDQPIVSYPQVAGDSSAATTTDVTRPALQPVLQHWGTRPVVGGGGGSQPPPGMFASLPSFAQAMYYQAATWAATKNGGGRDASNGTCDAQATRFACANTSGDL